MIGTEQKIDPKKPLSGPFSSGKVTYIKHKLLYIGNKGTATHIGYQGRWYG